MRGIEIQLRTRSRVHSTQQGKALTIAFAIGPIQVFVIANLPEEGPNEDRPLAYIKMNLKPDEGWTLFKEHNSTDPRNL